MSMRFLHVYSGNLFGGVERMLLSVAALAEPGFEHDFALCFESRLSQALRQRGAALHMLPSARIKRPLSIRRTRTALRRVLREGNFDAVICHGIWAYCIYAPTVAAMHAPILYLHDAPEPRTFLYRWAWLNRPRLCIANSGYIAGLAEQMRPRVQIEVVHPLVPAPALHNPAIAQDLRALLGARAGEVVILQASRLDPWKGHRNLLGALRAIRDVPSWTCWIAGSPQRPAEAEYQRQLQAEVATFGLGDRVKFIGHRDDMETVLAACDIYCQPNEMPEPFGMVFIEALFAGKPVVGSATGGTRDIISPACGIVCDPAGNELAAALERLVRDRGVRAEMSTNAPSRAAELCGSGAFINRMREVISKVAR